jgi:hypothetical protein
MTDDPVVRTWRHHSGRRHGRRGSHPDLLRRVVVTIERPMVAPSPRSPLVTPGWFRRHRAGARRLTQTDVRLIHYRRSCGTAQGLPGSGPSAAPPASHALPTPQWLLRFLRVGNFQHGPWLSPHGLRDPMQRGKSGPHQSVAPASPAAAKQRNARGRKAPTAPGRSDAFGGGKHPMHRENPPPVPALIHVCPHRGGQNPMHLNATAPPAKVRADVRCAGRVRMRCRPLGTAHRSAERAGNTPCTTRSASRSGSRHHVGARMRPTPSYARRYNGDATLATQSHHPAGRAARPNPMHLYRCAPLPSVRGHGRRPLMQGGTTVTQRWPPRRTQPRQPPGRAARPKPHAPDHRRASCAEPRTASWTIPVNAEGPHARRRITPGART